MRGAQVDKMEMERVILEVRILVEIEGRTVDWWDSKIVSV